MNELIKVEGCVINGESIQTINARELHAFLESGIRFNDWIKKRISEYGFIEGIDYVRHELAAGVKMSDSSDGMGGLINAQKNVALESTGCKNFGQQGRIEYAVTLDMAKELSMVERNEKGKQARQYFIECERRAKTAGFSLPDFTDPEIAARAWADQFAAKRLAERQLEEARPKVEFHDAVADSVNRQTMQQIAKELNVGPNKLFDFLRKEEVLMDDNLPYQRYIDAGYFRVIMRQYTDQKGEERISSRTFVTGKGAIYIQKLVKGHSELMAGVLRKKVILHPGAPELA